MKNKIINIPYKKSILKNKRSTSDNNKKNILSFNKYNTSYIKNKIPTDKMNSNGLNDEFTQTESVTDSTNYETSKKIFEKYKVKTSICKNQRIIYCKNCPRKRNMITRNPSEDILNKGFSYLSENKTKKKSNLNINNFNQYNNIFLNNNYKNLDFNNYLINLEDLIILEGIFDNVLLSLKNKINIPNECFELINFYNYSSLYNKFEKYFKSQDQKNIIHFTINIILYDIILTYHCSFIKFIFNKKFFYINEIIKINHKCYLLICEYIYNKVSISDIGNIWVDKLKIMLDKKIKHVNPKKDTKFIYFLKSKNLINQVTINNILEIKYYLYLTQNYLKEILNNFIIDEIQENFINIYNNISVISSDEIIKFFTKKIMKIINKEGSLYGNEEELLRLKNKNFEIKGPYLNYISNKKFTLVLDLDETLISFKLSENSENKGSLRLRPGLNDFLNSIKNYYEMILFTSATKDYADPLLRIIEKDKKIFDFKLYRQHTIIFENDFIKDISKLGRDMSKVIIIDNLPQNFRLQKENGIMIKAFWGEDVYDIALFELKDILIEIATKFDDVREGILFFKRDIISKVSSNF